MRWMYAFLAVLYAFVLGVLLYFRFGPYRRVMERLAEDGVAMPGWFSALFSFGILAVGLFLVWRGVGAARKALNPPRSDSE
jgi:hypothetical protein